MERIGERDQGPEVQAARPRCPDSWRQMVTIEASSSVLQQKAMNRSSFLSPVASHRDQDKDVFSNSMFFSDKSAKGQSPHQAMSLSTAGAQFSDSLNRYSMRKPFAPEQLRSPVMETRNASDQHNALRSHSKPGLPPISSSILDDAASRRSTTNDFHSRPHGSAVKPQEEPSFAAVDTPLRIADFSHSAVHHSPVVDLVASLPVNRMDALWNSWIVIFGFSASHSVHGILQLFQEYGEIVQHRVGEGNWLFIRYAHPVQAERAASSHLVYLSSTSVVGVQQMSTALGKQLNVTLSADGWIQQPTFAHGAQETPASKAGEAARHPLLLATENAGLRRRVPTADASAPPGEDLQDSLYVKPRRRKSICEQIVDYFWAY